MTNVGEDHGRGSDDAEHARLIRDLCDAHEQLHPDLEAMTRLVKVGSLFIRDGNLEQVLGEILDAAIAIVDADFGTIQILDRGSAELRIAAQRGFERWWLEFWDAVGKGRGVCGTALEHGARIIVEDVETSSIFAGTRALEIQLRAGVRRAQSTPLIGRSGEPIGMLSTHGKRPGKPSESALRLLDLLARQAADILERARAEEALRMVHTQLVEANRRKDEFLAMLSHELRNPLTPIRNSLIILQQTSDAAQARQAREIIDRQLHHMTRLVDELLDVSRITRGKVQLHRERIDLDDLVRHTVEDHRMGFANAGIGLEMSLAQTEVCVNADRTRLAQVLGNLLHNAGKFTPPGGKVTITVGEDRSRKLALIDVQDTGRGIAPTLLPHVFEAFTQGDTTIDRSAGGLGLGLSVVKALIELHGGSVSARSEGPGKGVTFAIALPVDTDSVPTIQKLHSNEALTHRRVLIIDDSVDAAESLAAVLELDGHVVEVAHRGLHGLDKARSSLPDLVICDIGLPDIDGFEVARRMRADPMFDRVSLVALTGYARPQDVAKAKHAGFDEHLAKPVHFDALRLVVATRART